MPDLSKLSDDQLKELYHSLPDDNEKPDLGKLSTAELVSLHKELPPETGTAKSYHNAAEVGARDAVSGIAGSLGDLTDLGARGIAAASNYVNDKLGLERYQPPEKKGVVAEALDQLPRAKDMQAYLEQQHGKTDEVTGRGEKFLRTGVAFGLGGAGGGAGRVKAAVNTALPAVVSEGAGQATEGTAAEPYARFGGALVGGGAAALATRPATAERVIAAQLPKGVTPQMFDQAQALMDHAKSLGVDLALPEALSQVAGKPVLTNLMRHLEGAHQTEGQMAEFFGNRPQQVENAARGQFDNIAPVNNAPSTVGPAIGTAAEQTSNDIRSAINRATKPSYDAAAQTLVPPQVHATMRGDPLFVDALDAVRNDPAKNSFVRGQSDRSVAVYDAVKKELEERATRASNPMQPGASQAVSSATGSLGDTVKDVAIAADKQANNGPSSYEAALSNQARLRQKYLNPVLQGPLGKLAGRDTTTKDAIEALFPSKPLANSEQEIETAVSALSKRNPRAAEDLVRAHVEGTFNEAAKDLQSGANQAGGAKFRTRLVGDPQQKLNLRSAVEALPNGEARWSGFNKFLDVVEATGTRQNVGSKTAYNAEFLKEQSKGGLAADAVKTVTAPQKFLEKFNEHYERWKLGKDLGQLANILTDPNAGNLLRGLAKSNNAGQNQAVALRLLSYANNSRSPVKQSNQ